jgi:hypothetical protein
MATVAICPIAKATSTTNTYGIFFLEFKKKKIHMGGSKKGGPRDEIFFLKKKRPMGVVEGCPGYWCRDGSCNGYFCQRFSGFSRCTSGYI